MRKKCVLIILCIFCILLGGCNTMEHLIPLQKEENSNLYSNPSKVNNIGDPFVLRAKDGFYYMYCTSSSNGYYCWKSEDLVNWTDKKVVYMKTEESWATECFWAPEVFEQDGTYYMYLTAKNRNGSLRIGVATSSTPDGLFKDALDKPLFDDGYAAIDATVFTDDDGKKYLYYARDCSENFQNGIRKSEIYGVQLNDDMISVSGEPVLLTTPTQLWETGTSDTYWNEGPAVIKHNGTYYLTYSANFYASPAYSVGYATSDSPLGTYTKSSDNPILTAGTYKNISGPGHHSFTTGLDGKELFMVYHSHTFPGVGGGNRQVNIDRVMFTESGEMYVDGPTISSQPKPYTSSCFNVASTSKVTVNAVDTKLLTDGIFTIHKKNQSYDLVSNLNENGQVVILIDLLEKRKISDILVYRGVHDETDFSSFDLIIDDKYISEGCLLPDNSEQRAAILSFSKVEARKLKIILRPKNNQSEISLSEISVLGY
jgi:GH43 family beta-xylosidase